ncbi:MAG: hypothetical protein QOF63_2089 [Thermoanaerobaculia bacterium]|nr:hypothetical protein [Thermoanaerobaculia bacterium]MEA2415883.1 hypothetical protein [Thermoanaerobaculia bacterium]
MSDAVAAAIPGSEQVIAWFGSWPTFHDAEVLEVSLKREGESCLRIQICKPQEPHSSVSDDQAVVSFWFEGIVDLELTDFGVQNVIFELRLSQTENGYRATMSPCFGIAGYLEAKQVTISIETSSLTDAAGS